MKPTQAVSNVTHMLILISRPYLAQSAVWQNRANSYTVFYMKLLYGSNYNVII